MQGKSAVIDSSCLLLASYRGVELVSVLVTYQIEPLNIITTDVSSLLNLIEHNIT